MSQRVFCAALVLLGVAFLPAPSVLAAAGGNPFLAEASQQEAPAEQGRDKAAKGEGSAEEGSADRCGGWGGHSDHDPMESHPDEGELGKCGRCFGGDD